MENNIMEIESKFFASLGNGVNAGRYLADMINSVVVSRDTTVLTRAIQRATASKNDDGAARAIRLCVGQVWQGAKVTKAKDGKSFSIKIKGLQADVDALERINEAVDRGLSIRHATFAKCVKGEQADNADKPVDTAKKASNFVKAMRDAGLTDAAIKAMVDTAMRGELEALAQVA